MSRVGNSSIPVPSGVNVNIVGHRFEAKGKLGNLGFDIPSFLEVQSENNTLKVVLKEKTKQARMMWGTTVRVLNNLVKGVSEGFAVNLEINGVGYRAAVQGSDLVLQLGFSHEVRYPIPAGITMKCDKPTTIQIFGADRQRVGQIAAEIRSFRAPEPYKGKGIMYEGEKIVRKEGKKK